MALLEVKNIRKNFGKTEVLRGIDFSVDKGEVVAIIGSSGSGKTTLLRCLNLLERADVGSITVADNVIYDAADTSKQSEESIRKKRLNLGLIFQSFNLFPQYTALENVMLAPKLSLLESIKKKVVPASEKAARLAEIKAEAQELLAQVGLSDRCDYYPGQLSGGQQQRVAIARALALKPALLCFDEPTSALDPELTGEVLRVIRSLKDEGRTMVVVTHEMEFARHVADRVIFMADGHIVEQGPADEVLGNPQTAQLRAFLHKAGEGLAD
jgi:polar amino acid transport system ATP-binding protein